MSLVVAGVSHKTAPVELRERLAIPAERLSGALHQLVALPGVQEAVLLSTCNRFEIYARTNGGVALAQSSITSFLQSLYDKTSLTSAIYDFNGVSAVRHLFRVVSGLDSLVIGESEILGQVKNAYGDAHKNKATGKITNVLFQRALYVGKHVRTVTRISEGASSVGSTAVQMAERIFGQLNNHRILVLGAGKMAEVTVRHLLSQKAGSLVILNRTMSRAEELARQWSGRPGSMDQLHDELVSADIVICSTSAEKPFITKPLMAEIMKARRDRSLYIVDIAVPRNVSADVNDLDNVYLYNIDDLEALVQEHLSHRQSKVKEAEKLIHVLAQEFDVWLEAALDGREAALRHQSADTTADKPAVSQ
jgi:glutamyl-tRNA reductase